MGYLAKRLGVAIAAVLLMAAVAGADERQPAQLIISQQTIQQALQATSRSSGVPRQRASSSHTGRRVAWTAIGAAGGFFAGGYVGSTIDRRIHDCNCDDPGFKGLLIGAPIGAIAGGIAGFVASR
jgi:hypothetical protein